MQKGDRVGAVSHGKGKYLALFGYGEFVGYERPSEHKDKPVGLVAESIVKFDSTNPLIKLDSGEYVWGCECWWGAEETVRKHCDALIEKGGTVETVDIIEKRLEYDAKANDR